MLPKLTFKESLLVQILSANTHFGPAIVYDLKIINNNNNFSALTICEELHLDPKIYFSINDNFLDELMFQFEHVDDRINYRYESVYDEEDDLNGETPLTTSILHEAINITTNLLALGADITFKNRDGISPLKIACKSKNLDAVEKIIQIMEKKKIDIKEDANECVEYLLKNIEEEEETQPTINMLIEIVDAFNLNIINLTKKCKKKRQRILSFFGIRE